jgi:alpha-N-arabinofuranosidase
VVNRHPADSVELSLDLGSLGSVAVETALVLSDEDVHAVNTAAQPLRVRPVPLSSARLEGSSLKTRLPPVAWAMIRFATA